jgi:hypothetical protein
MVCPALQHATLATCGRRAGRADWRVVLWHRFLAAILGIEALGTALGLFGVADFSLSFVWSAGAFHASFPLLADAWQAKQTAGAGAALGDVTTDPTFHYFGLLFVASMPSAAIATALLAYAVIWKNTRYPRWFAAMNPALLFLLTRAFVWMPAPLGGLLIIGAGNMVFLLFFACSTALLWNGGLRQDIGD